MTTTSVPNRRFSGPIAMVLGLALAVTPIAWAQGGSKTKAQIKKEADEAKYRIKPTMDPRSPTKVAIPKDLDAAFTELDKMLSKELREEMRKGGASGMGQYHFGLGMWIRNNWGLWKGLELAKWFNKKGVFHPDDMSGVILTSYGRRLNGKPIDLAGQVKGYQEYWKAARKAEEAEKARAGKAKVAIKGMMMGLSVDPAPPTVVRFPEAERSGFRTRYAAPFGSGVLVTAKRFDKDTFNREPDYDIRSFYIDLQGRTLRPVATREGDVVEDCVVIDGHAYLNCVSGAKGHILDLTGDERRTMPWPAFPTRHNFPVRLGIERAEGGKPAHLLALGGGKLARWNAGHWEPIPCGAATFPTCILPAQKIGNRLAFRDEGQHEDDKRLSWIDLSRPKGLVTFDRHIGVVGSEGPRWENVWDYAVGRNGAWWISTGSTFGNQSLLRWTPQTGYRVGLYNDTAVWTGDFFTSSDSKEDTPAHALAVTGLEPLGDDALTAIGPHGLFVIRGTILRRVYKFENVPQGWTPSTLLTLVTGLILVGGHWGGLFLLEGSKSGTINPINIEEGGGKPILL